MQILNFLAAKGCACYLYDENNILTVIKNSKITLKARNNGYISVFACGDRAEGVTISGLKYVVNDVILTNDFPIGVSNEFVGNDAEISVRNGMLLITTEF